MESESEHRNKLTCKKATATAMTGCGGLDWAAVKLSMPLLSLPLRQAYLTQVEAVAKRTGLMGQR